MTLKAKIQQDIIIAMKAGDKPKLEALRYLMSQLKDKEIEQRRKELTDEGVIQLINGQLKKLEESLVLFNQGKRQDLVDKTKQESAILQAYLPKQISDEQLEKLVEEIIKANPGVTNPGMLIGISVKKLSGKADNKRISQMVLKKISNI